MQNDDYCSYGVKREQPLTKSQCRRIELQEENADDLMDEVYLDKAIDFEEGLQDE